MTIKLNKKDAEEHYSALIDSKSQINSFGDIKYDSKSNVLAKTKSKNSHVDSISLETLLEEVLDGDTKAFNNIQQEFFQLDKEEKNKIAATLKNY